MAIEWHVGDVVRKLRDSAGLTQGLLAKAVCTRPATICRIEKTGKHKPEILAKIAQALKTTVANIHAQAPAAASMADPKPICQKHQRLLEMLDEILHDESSPLGSWIAGNVITFHNQWKLGQPPAMDLDNVCIASTNEVADLARTTKPRIRVRKI